MNHKRNKKKERKEGRKKGEKNASAPSKSFIKIRSIEEIKISKSQISNLKEGGRKEGKKEGRLYDDDSPLSTNTHERKGEMEM